MNNQLTQISSREIRVFISSTFRDMMRERDLLVKRVFPELRRKCAQRFVTFTEVDLRWGITEEQSAVGQVLPLCLAEIERSRPYFLGLLGERYGWIPDTVRPEVLEREPWIREHVEDRTSVTELEILHGVLRNPEMTGHAFFYFRDPSYGQDPERYPDFTDDERWALVEQDIPDEIEKYGMAEAARRTAQRKARLASLKQRIRDSKLDLVEPYANPEALAEIVFQQFDELIDQLYPEGQTPDPLTQERMRHEAHAKNKLYGCIDRPAHMAKLTEIAHSDDKLGKGIVLTGESGGGKTALLAAWARDVARDNPDVWLFQHYFGATPDSAAPEGFLRRLMGELKQRFGIAEDIPADPDKLRDALPVWLARTPPERRIVLVLDGLNQVQGCEADCRLRFVPYTFPAHVTVLASALSGPALDALREREWMMYELPLATEAEADAMVAKYLKQIGRFVDAEGRPIETPLRCQIAAAPGSRNPLFLRTVLEELRQFGSFENLNDRVAHYLEANDPKDLFLRVIQRWQDDFDDKDSEGRDRDLVRRALTHLCAVRQGLSEPEWLDLLGTADYQPPPTDRFSPLPRAFWTPLFLALEPHLSQRSGLFAYGHDFLRQAVEQKWLAEPTAQHAAHLALADYFEQHPNQADMTPRKAAEWPYHLHAAQSWDRLEACLTNIPLFLALDNAQTKVELVGYWHPLRAMPLERDMGLCYTTAYDAWTQDYAHSADHSVGANLGVFLFENGLYTAAEPLLCRVLEARKCVLGPEHPDTLTCMNNLAVLLGKKGNYAGAQPLYWRALEARERVLGPEHPDTLMSLKNLASLLEKKGDYAGAQPLYERALEASVRVLGPEHPNTLIIVDNLAGLLVNKGDYADAQSLYEGALEASERELGPEHPDTLGGVNNLATLLEKMGDYADAQSLYERALEASERILGPEHPNTLMSVSNIGNLLRNMGDYEGAQPFCERALEVNERILGPEHPNTLTSINSLAVLLMSKGDYAGAQSLYERTLEARKRILGSEHPDTMVSVNNLANLLENTGDYAAAQPLYELSLEARERVLGPEHPDTLTSMNSLAVLFVNKGDYTGAQPLYERALEARGRVLGLEHPDTLVSVNNLAALLLRKGDYAGAQPLYERMLEVCERVLGPEHPDTLTSVINFAGLLSSKGDYVGAQPLYERALIIFERVLGPEHPNTLKSVNNLAALLVNKGDCAGAKPLYERTLEVFNRVLGPEHPDTLTSVINFAGLLSSKGDFAGAQPLYERALNGLLKISAAIGNTHPNLQVCINNYAGCFKKMGRGDAEIRAALNDLMRPFGMSVGSAGGTDNGQTSHP
ncbi:tetratricopeptide repeat protein [Desulfonatronum parangueonense]